MRKLVIGLAVVGFLVVPGRIALAQAAPKPFTVEELLKVRRVSDPRLSPDGRRVAYVVTDVSLDRNARVNHIWLVPVAGGDPARLVAGEASEDSPRWSPDGKRIAFVSARESGSQVWVTDAVPGSTPRRVTSLATEASGAKWSPDGRWLLFVSDVYPECAEAACNERALKAFETRPSKAHVFDTLLFRHWTTWKDGRFSHLFIVAADGSAPPRDLTPGRADVPPFSLGGPDDYAVSPDSREVAFAKKTDPVEAISTNSDLFIVDLTSASAQPKPITTSAGNDGGPVYSPDGRFIAYRRQARAGFEADRWELMLFDRGTGEHRSITPSFDRGVDSYVWEPRSTSLIVVAEDRGEMPVLRVGVGGAEPTPLLTGAVFGDVQVSGDGNSLDLLAKHHQGPDRDLASGGRWIGGRSGDAHQRRLHGRLRSEAG